MPTHMTPEAEEDFKRRQAEGRERLAADPERRAKLAATQEALRARRNGAAPAARPVRPSPGKAVAPAPAPAPSAPGPGAPAAAAPSPRGPVAPLEVLLAANPPEMHADIREAHEAFRKGGPGSFPGMMAILVHALSNVVGALPGEVHAAADRLARERQEIETQRRRQAADEQTRRTELDQTLKEVATLRGELATARTDLAATVRGLPAAVAAALPVAQIGEAFRSRAELALGPAVATLNAEAAGCREAAIEAEVTRMALGETLQGVRAGADSMRESFRGLNLSRGLHLAVIVFLVVGGALAFWWRGVTSRPEYQVAKTLRALNGDGVTAETVPGTDGRNSYRLYIPRPSTARVERGESGDNVFITWPAATKR